MMGAIYFTHEQDASRARELASHFSLELNPLVFPRLQVMNQRLFLLDTHAQAIALDWNDEKWLQRSQGMTGSDPLIRATLARQSVRIIDMTAGWGKDGLLMAHAGARVVMLEQHPYMAALLMDAWQHLLASEVKSRIQVVWSSAIDYLMPLEKMSYPDVIYCDPMHPIRKKSALVKKHLQILQHLAKPNEDVIELIHLAQQRCTQRVVLKWPQKQNIPLSPMGSIEGKTIRYALYKPLNERNDTSF